MDIRQFISLIFTPSFIRKLNFSFSQEGEDVILHDIFINEQKKYAGLYVDIGAHHPARFSNTYMLYKCGWNGINIDATPNSMKLFRKYRKRDINLEIAISEKEKDMPFFIFHEGALNTFDEKIAEEYIAKGYGLKEKKLLRAYNVNDVLEKYVGDRKIDLLDIDIEGLDDLVIQTLDWNRFSPEIILAEKLFGEDGELQSNGILKKHGYVLYATTGRTAIYKKV